MRILLPKRPALATYDKRIAKESIMSFSQRLVFGVLLFTAIFFLGRYLFWWINPNHAPRNFIDISHSLYGVNWLIYALLTFVVFIGPLLRVATWFALWFGARPKYISPQKGLKVALVTCFVPGEEPHEMLEDTLEAMLLVRYPHDSWVLDEGNDPNVKKLCKKLGVKHFSRAGIKKYNQETGEFRRKTKAGNHNAWRDKFENHYDVVGQIDVDNAPRPGYFGRTLGYFSDPKVGLVVMPQVYKNLDNWVARGAAEQAYFFHGPMQQGFYGSDMPLLIGTNHIYRTSAMKQIGGYAPTIVEDHLTGMNFYANGFKGVFVPEVLAEGEGPQNWVDYLNQQMRWSYGLFEILFKHTPKTIWKLKLRQKINYFFSQLYYFTGVAVFLGMVLSIFYLTFGVRAANMNLTEWVRYAVPAFLLTFLIQIYTHRFHINPKKEPYFGFLGMFLNLGANLIYTIAFFNFIVGKKLRYVVTPKGSYAKNRELPLKPFYPHMVFGLVSLFALVVSFITGNGAMQIRFWAAFNIATISAIALSTYWDRIYGWFNSHRYALALARVSLNLIVAAFAIAALTFGYSQKQLLVQAFMAPQEDIKPIDNIFLPLASKLEPLQSGVFLGISLYYSNDSRTLEELEKTLDRKFSLVGYFQSWGAENNRFNFDNTQSISEHGALPFITWEPWQPVGGLNRSQEEVNQEKYRLEKITNGQYDAYIENYAKDIKAYKKPVMIRFAHEMNGNWYPWGSTYNTPEEYTAAWRHVHGIFEAVGATNVTWVWAPNELYTDKNVPNSKNLELFYPGDEYVDWVGFSSFNWGNSYKHNSWRNPDEMFTDNLNIIKKFNKPIIIAETASIDLPENHTEKVNWLKNLSEYINSHQEIKGIVWFNTVDSGVDWTINSSEESQDAFKETFTNSNFH